MNTMETNHTHPCCEKQDPQERLIKAFHRLQKFSLDNLGPEKRMELAALIQEYVDLRISFKDQ